MYKLTKTMLQNLKFLLYLDKTTKTWKNFKKNVDKSTLTWYNKTRNKKPPRNSGEDISDAGDDPARKRANHERD